MINATQIGVSSKDLFIPIPDATRPFGDYKSFYKETVSLPDSYIRYSEPFDEVYPIPYDLDEEDETWLASLNASIRAKSAAPVSEDVFESIFALFEEEQHRTNESGQRSRPLPQASSVGFLNLPC